MIPKNVIVLSFVEPSLIFDFLAPLAHYAEVIKDFSNLDHLYSDQAFDSLIPAKFIEPLSLQQWKSILHDVTDKSRATLVLCS